VDRLVEFLLDPDTHVQSNAADVLGRMGPAAARPDVVDRLVDCLRDPDKPIWNAAAEALGKLGAARPDAVNLLSAQLISPRWEPGRHVWPAEKALGLMMDSGARFFRATEGWTVAWVGELSR
jgi:hypothetical protein